MPALPAAARSSRDPAIWPLLSRSNGSRGIRLPHRAIWWWLWICSSPQQSSPQFPVASAIPGSGHYAALAGLVAPRLTGGYLLLASDFQAGVPGRFFVANGYCCRISLTGGWFPGRHCDARRYVRRRHNFALLADSAVANRREPRAPALFDACALSSLVATPRFCSAIASQPRWPLSLVGGGVDDRGEPGCRTWPNWASR